MGIRGLWQALRRRWRSAPLFGVLIVSAVLCGLSGSALLAFSSSNRLITLGSVLVGIAITCLVGAIGLWAMATEERRARLAAALLARDEVSRSTATRLHGSQDHAGQNLAGTVLMHRTNLTEVNFDKAILDGIDWTECRWTRCSFREAIALQAKLFVFAEHCDFTDAVLDGLTVRGDLEKCTFSGASVGDATFHAVDMRFVKFDRSDRGPCYLKRSSFKRNGMLDGSEFTGADCEHADFSETTLYGVIFDQAFLGSAIFESPWV